MFACAYKQINRESEKMGDLLHGKICLITGCSRGIGAATVRRVAEEGAIVYVGARKEGNIDQMCGKQTADYDTSVIPVYFGVTDTAAAKAVILRIKKVELIVDANNNNALGFYKKMNYEIDRITLSKCVG